MAWADAAHAVVVHELGPRSPHSKEISPADVFGIIMTRVYGLPHSGPRVLSTSMPVSREPIPPMPVAYTTPMRSESMLVSSLEASMASRVAVSAN